MRDVAILVFTGRAVACLRSTLCFVDPGFNATRNRMAATYVGNVRFLTRILAACRSTLLNDIA
jgi:hypothetical protein